ncbi:MAG: hypothetical protein LH609_00790, partial [Rudanella sp.]|nr:hypothetical protein [Rudanella sp.]
GDEKAFRALYEQTKSRVFNTALSYVRSHEDAEEIVQDVFVEVFRSVGGFRVETGILTWINGGSRPPDDNTENRPFRP